MLFILGDGYYSLFIIDYNLLRFVIMASKYKPPAKGLANKKKI